MRKLLLLFAIFGLILSGCLYSYEVGSGEAGDDDSGDDDSSNCDDNKAPELIALHYFVDATEIYPPITVEANQFANFTIRVEFKDDDCNLAGGTFYLNFNGGGWEEVGQLPKDLPCATSTSGYLYPLKLVDITGELSSGNYSGEIKWADVCGDESNTLDFEFTILP